MVLPPVTPRPDKLPLNDPNFSWDRFESFCLDFISQIPGVKNCHRYGTQGDSQKGIDVYAELTNGVTWAFQCKQYEKYTENKAKEVIQKATYPADRYILLLSCEATAKVRDAVSGSPNWDVWDVQDISQRVRNLPQDVAYRLINTHFGSTWSKEFLGLAESTEFISLNKCHDETSILLKKIQKAFEKDLATLNKNSGHPNGIALSKLAHLAIEEEGDFDVAIEAFMSLLRLAHEIRDKGLTGYVSGEKDASKLVIQPVNTTLQSANITNSATKVLKLFAKTDYELLRKANEKARLYSLIGDAQFSQLSNYSQIPHGSFGAVNTIWNSTCLELYLAGMELEAKEITRLMYNTLLGLAFVIHQRGISCPEAPKVMHKTISGERWIAPDQHKDLLPIISLANAIATLPIELFSYALEGFRYFTGIMPLQKISDTGKKLMDELEVVRRWAVIPGLAVVCGISLETQQDLETFNNELQAVHVSGNEISIKLVEYLLAERSLALKEDAWIGFDPSKVVNKLLSFS
ncbi:restriction endonuclease (plasmid) [Kovacikia minuta CCNUW1]|uniref:restriction endonuclease n=1 Tax=Kovacikia minuta TaxID=2931930 RepID=UPI001CCE202C|nr:restriction endonuclease [Kovacikia minuta]UBF30537.1 restriction endonuclease [Kovacikia minuta CCNUW1]